MCKICYHDTDWSLAALLLQCYHDTDWSLDALLYIAMTYLIADKCLAPYYGGCDTIRECVNSRNNVSCGGCLPGFMEISGGSGEKFCGSKFMP